MHPTVLIISNPTDQHARAVQKRLAELGVKAIAFSPEFLGQGNAYTWSTSTESATDEHCFVINGEQVHFNDISAIWFRRPRLVSLDHYNLSLQALEFAREEWRATLEAAYALCPHILWVSHPDCLRTAARKPLQLELAVKVGFPIPRTLITNRPEYARAFIKDCRGHVIAKPSGAGWVYGPDRSSVTYVLTNRIGAEQFDSLDDIELAPVTLQEEISKVYEIRVNVVGQEVLAIKIDSQKSPVSALDWRRYDVANTPYTPYQLPRTIEQKCLTIVKLLGLEFGAIDLIRTPNDEYVFLEVNGNGQFLWAELLSGVQVSDAIARLLAGLATPLQSLNVEQEKGEAVSGSK